MYQSVNEFYYITDQNIIEKKKRHDQPNSYRKKKFYKVNFYS